MSEVSLTNQVDVTGQYESSAISFSSNIVTTKIVQGLTVNKTADKSNWVDGPLTYTVEIQNSSGNPLTDGIMTDNLNTDLIEFNTNFGVQIDGSPSSAYTYSGGELKITLPTLDNDNSTTIKFQVTKK